MSEHAVLIHLPGSSESMDLLTDVAEIEDALIEAIDHADAGHLDGNEIDHHTGDIVIYTYGPNADRLAKPITNMLTGSRYTGTYLIKRYGGPGAREHREEIAHSMA